MSSGCSHTQASQRKSKDQGSVPERPMSANPELKFCSTLCIYLPAHCLE